MIGDSITASAAKRYGGEFCDALVPLGWQVEVDAEPSRFVDFGNDVLDKRLSAKWDAAYVFLGTNYLGDQLCVPQAAREDRRAVVAEPGGAADRDAVRGQSPRSQRRDHPGRRRVPQRSHPRLGFHRRGRRGERSCAATATT